MIKRFYLLSLAIVLANIQLTLNAKNDKQEQQALSENVVVNSTEMNVSAKPEYSLVFQDTPQDLKAKKSKNEDMQHPLWILDPIWSYGVNVGGTYSGDFDRPFWKGDGRKQGYIGGLVGMSDSFRRGKDFKCYTFEAGAYMGKYGSNKINFIPAIGASFTKSFLYLRAMFTPNFMHPTVGINVMNLFQIQTGYYVPFKNKNHTKIEGFSIGLNITVGYKHLYNYKDF